MWFYYYRLYPGVGEPHLKNWGNLFEIPGPDLSEHREDWSIFTFSGWLRLASVEGGRVQDPCEYPNPRAWVQLDRKEELTVGDCVWTLLWVSSRRSLRQKQGWNWKATLNCLNHSTNSLFLQVTSRAKTCGFTTQVAAAGPNGITGCRRRLLPLCPRGAVLGHRVSKLWEWEGSPGCPAVPWSLFIGLCFLQPVSHLLNPISVPDSLSPSKAPHPRCFAQLARATAACRLYSSPGLMPLPTASHQQTAPCLLLVSPAPRCYLSLSGLPGDDGREPKGDSPLAPCCSNAVSCITWAVHSQNNLQCRSRI